MMTIAQLVRGTDAKTNVEAAVQRLKDAKKYRADSAKHVRDTKIYLKGVSVALVLAAEDERMAERALQKARKEAKAVREDVLGSWRTAWAKTWEKVNESQN